MRTDPVINALRQGLVEAGLAEAGTGLVLAVSGGSDSMAMLLAAHHARRALRIRGPVEAVTIDHRLRRESRDEVRFVREAAESFGIPFHAVRLRLRKEAPGSLEERARRARYRHLVARARRIGARAVLVAHTADDQAETVLMNLIRGAVVRGLGAMPPVRLLRKRPALLLVRPLLGCTREELQRFLGRHGIGWCEDRSNRSLDYTRNRIRHVLLPLLTSQFNPDMARGLVRLAARSRAADSFLREDAEERLSELTLSRSSTEIALDAGTFSELHSIRRFYVLDAGASALAGGGRSLKWSDLEVVDATLGPRQGRGLLSVGLAVRREREHLVVSKLPPNRRRRMEPVKLAIPGTTSLRALGGELTAVVSGRDRFDLDEFLKTKSTFEEAFDHDRVRKPLHLRAAGGSDRFHPLGGHPRRLAAFLKSQGVRAADRARQPVVACGEAIIWVVGLRAAHGSRITDATRRVLLLTWNENAS